MSAEQGRQRRIDPDLRDAIVEARRDGLTWKQLVDTFSVSRETVQVALESAGLLNKKPNKWHPEIAIAQAPRPVSKRKDGLLDVFAALPGEWVHEALCAQVDPDLFFPEQGCASHGVKAKKICAQCPVKAECQAYAVENKELYGIWGGDGEKQRRPLIKATEHAATEVA